MTRARIRARIPKRALSSEPRSRDFWRNRPAVYGGQDGRIRLSAAPFTGLWRGTVSAIERSGQREGQGRGLGWGHASPTNARFDKGSA
jgi:hypothetical protein